MPYIVKSSLDIGGKIIPWNERETKKLIREKEQFLKEKHRKTEELKQEEERQEKQESLKKTESKAKKGKE